MLRELLPVFCHDLDIKVIPVNLANQLDGLQNLLEKFRSKFDLITISSHHPPFRVHSVDRIL